MNIEILQKPLWSYKDLSEYLEVSVTNLRHKVMLRQISFIKIGHAVRFKKEEIDKFYKIPSSNPDSTRVIIHDSQIKQVDRVVVEKLR